MDVMSSRTCSEFWATVVRPWFIKQNQKQQQQQNKQKNSKNGSNMVAHTCDPETGLDPMLEASLGYKGRPRFKSKIKNNNNFSTLFLYKYFSLLGEGYEKLILSTGQTRKEFFSTSLGMSVKEFLMSINDECPFFSIKIDQPKDQYSINLPSFIKLLCKVI